MKIKTANPEEKKEMDANKNLCRVQKVDTVYVMSTVQLAESCNLQRRVVDDQKYLLNQI